MIDLNAANHTNRELELMLAEKKPLAMFYDETSVLPHEEIIPEEKFAPYVSAGLFVRGEETYTGEFHPGLNRNIQIKYVFFALAREAWRIPAISLLLRVRYQMNSWQCEEVERMESFLLGYTADEIDAWCNHRFPRGAEGSIEAVPCDAQANG
jgi:hypothetical protein